MLIVIGKVCINLDHVSKFFIKESENEKSEMVFVFSETNETENEICINFPSPEDLKRCFIHIFECYDSNKKVCALNIRLDKKQEE